MSKTAQTGEWRQLPWQKLEVHVFKLQKKIYRASVNGEIPKVRQLQKLLLKSQAAKLIAVRKVTQDNRGKKTAGIDGVKSLTPSQRLKLAEKLTIGGQASPVRRVWIEKPGKTEKRPLGIPTMHDRALQCLVKLAIEPEWEARFESNSYGFRPGRSCHDAIVAIHTAINQKPKWVLDADIAQCFDRINHSALLDKLNTFPAMRQQIKSWLKAGVVDFSSWSNREKIYHPTSEGTPQGGICSPLLANIALHGLETKLLQFIETVSLRTPAGKVMPKVDRRKSLGVIRYADDFVVMHQDREIVQKCQLLVAEWLAQMGLELKPSKTHLIHTLHPTNEGHVGFDFLSFKVRQFKVGKHTSKRGYKTIITPSAKALKAHTRKVGDIIERHKNAPKIALISKLKPVIRGWCNYHRGCSSKKTFIKADYITYQQLRGWAMFRHSKNQRRRHKADGEWVKKPSPLTGKLRRSFCAGELELGCHADTKIVRQTKVKGMKSPYDGDWVYWSNRRGHYPGVKKTVSQLLRHQEGKCSHCDLYFGSDDLLEIHHQDGNHQNNRRNNLTLVHRHCHDQLHALGNIDEWELRSDDPYQVAKTI
jgi:RNA-directed DNA polymerase